MFVCLELIQIHIFEPIWTRLCTRLPLGLEEVVGYVWTHNISTSPPFRPILSGASADSCAEDGCWRQSPPLLHYIRDAARVGVTSRNAKKTRRSERNACVKMATWWGGEEVNNELHLQLHCICTNDNVKPIEPSSVLLPYAVKGQHILSPSQPSPSFQRYVSLTGWQHRCSVERAMKRGLWLP